MNIRTSGPQILGVKGLKMLEYVAHSIIEIENQMKLDVKTKKGVKSYEFLHWTSKGCERLRVIGYRKERFFYSKDDMFNEGVTSKDAKVPFGIRVNRLNKCNNYTYSCKTTKKL